MQKNHCGGGVEMREEGSKLRIIQSSFVDVCAQSDAGESRHGFRAIQFRACALDIGKGSGGEKAKPL
jgi:hypothetical protein